jgi:hypothetical protein
MANLNSDSSNSKIYIDISYIFAGVLLIIKELKNIKNKVNYFIYIK